MNLDKLENPPVYFPIEKGIYEVSPGLRAFGTEFGNGNADKRLFQIDREFFRFRESKLAARQESLNKYYLQHKLSQELRREICKFICNRLVLEYPTFFCLKGESLFCELTNESLNFNKEWDFLDSTSEVLPRYTDGLDALACQIQEDFALQQLTPDGQNYLASLHVCSPAHWAPENKIGRDFTKVHKPVPGIQKINNAAKSFAEAMVKKGPFVRFVWGFASDNRLNHHPTPPSGVDKEVWHGRRFVDPATSNFFLRMERQVTWGFPSLNASLFTIRVLFLEGTLIRRDPEKRSLLLSALQGMTPESLRYKGLHGSIEPLTRWLTEI